MARLLLDTIYDARNPLPVTFSCDVVGALNGFKRFRTTAFATISGRDRLFSITEPTVVVP